MINERIIRQYFVKQVNVNDCGIASLRMILNYCGKEKAQLQLRKHFPSSENGNTLLELRNLGNEIGLKCKAVSMDLEFLRSLKQPCILHMRTQEGDGHYQVYFGSTNRNGTFYYLLADPAKYLHHIPEHDLNQLWTSRAALYFDDLQQTGQRAEPNWVILFKAGFFPGIIWLAVPALATIIAIFSVTFSWLLQRGINDPLTDQRTGILVVVVILLTMILVFKGGLTYLKQRMQIRLNLIVNDKLYSGLLSNLFNDLAFWGKPGDAPIIKSTTEIQKIQAAINALMTVVLSDGVLIAAMTVGLFYWLPLAGVINMIFIVCLILLTSRSLPKLSYDYACLNELSGGLETALKIRHRLNGEKVRYVNDHLSIARKWYDDYVKLSRKIAVESSRFNLLYEMIAAFSLILVFITGLIKVKQNVVPYSTFVILVVFTFLIGMLMNRICNACYTINDGAEAFKQFKANLKD